MRELLARILELQPSFTKNNTPEMQERGVIVRRNLPTALWENETALRQRMCIPEGDFFVEGRDGTGNKTEIPWVRIASKYLSPSATSGWYCVYLFKRDGSGVYLGLSHGSTRLEDGDFKPRERAETEELMRWARERVGTQINTIHGISHSIELGGRTKLSDAYKSTTVSALFYPSDALPSDSELLRDLELFASMLGTLYEAQMLGQSPESLSPEIIAVQKAVRPGRGQGFGLNAAERKAVELRAMAIATSHLIHLGYSVKDVSAKESYDLFAKAKDGRCLYIEVKGTTASPASVVLTANEVSYMREKSPATGLAIVHGIKLRRAETPSATEGTLRLISPWHITEEALRPLSYIYQVDSPT